MLAPNYIFRRLCRRGRVFEAIPNAILATATALREQEKRRRVREHPCDHK